MIQLGPVWIGVPDLLQRNDVGLQNLDRQPARACVLAGGRACVGVVGL